MDNSELIEENTPVNKMIKQMYSHFEDGFSVFEFFVSMNDEYWVEFKRFIEDQKNFYHIAFACWHWSCDKEWITKDELIDIMTEFEDLINTCELGRAGKIMEKHATPGWNMQVEFVIL